MLKTVTFLINIIFILSGCEDRARTPSAPHEEPGENFLKSDHEILANLKTHLHLDAVERGAGGRCLFHALRDQISKTELAAVSALWDAPVKNQVNNYDTLLDDEKADLLREITIFEEKQFLENALVKKFTDLPKDEQAWALEMAKDWYQELHNVDKTRTWFLVNKDTAAGKEKMWQFVINNRNTYWAKTGCKTNWAGSAEAIAFARILKRPLRIYGLDRATSIKGAILDANGIVLPFLDYNFGYRGDSLLLFQTGGGGHYQMLRTVTK